MYALGTIEFILATLVIERIVSWILLRGLTRISPHRRVRVAHALSLLILAGFSFPYFRTTGIGFFGAFGMILLPPTLFWLAVDQFYRRK